MAKDPAFLFYPGDWLGGTLGMSFEEKGAYLELLMLQFNRGHMTTHMIGQTVGQIWDKVQSKFEQDKDGLWFNERLDIEKFKRQTFTESRRNNIKGTNQYTKKEGQMNSHMDGHTTSHMENENNKVVISSLEVFKEKNKKEINIYVELENRKNDFKLKIANILKTTRIEYLPFKEDNLEFYNYWTEHGENDKKMRFEKEKVFDIALRLDRWQKKAEQNRYNQPSSIRQFGKPESKESRNVNNIANAVNELLNKSQNESIGSEY